MPLFRNVYRFYRCSSEWTDGWAAICEDECPQMALDASLRITPKVRKVGRETNVRFATQADTAICADEFPNGPATDCSVSVTSRDKLSFHNRPQASR